MQINLMLLLLLLYGQITKPELILSLLQAYILGPFTDRFLTFSHISTTKIPTLSPDKTEKYTPLVSGGASPYRL